MNSNVPSRKSIAALALCALFACGNTLAASANKAAEKQQDRHEHDSDYEHLGVRHFDNERRALVRDYYKGKQGGAACPPGLAKKGNGCLPPGQAKKWQLGYALQADNAYRSLPQELLNLLGTPPAGQHYGMIDEDILLLANVTELVLEVITGTD